MADEIISSEEKSFFKKDYPPPVFNPCNLIEYPYPIELDSNIQLVNNTFARVGEGSRTKAQQSIIEGNKVTPVRRKYVYVLIR
jgi:hypothetical protein